MSALRKNVSGQYLYFAMINASTGAALTGATVTGKLSIDGAAQASVTGTISEEAGGQYKIALSQADTNGNDIGYLFTATSAIPVQIMIFTTASDPSDSVRQGLTSLANAAAGASGGLIINGSNAGTVTLAALTVTAATTLTGNVALAAGLTITQSTTNGAGVSITGNGTGQGIISTGGATGPGAKFVGGGTSGDGIDITTTAGDGFAITPTAGSALVLTANGTSKHGLVATGGTAGTSDGFKAVAGTGGVPIRGDLTSNITGNLSGSVGSVTGAVGSVTGAVGSVTGNVGGNVVGTVASVVGAVGSVTGNVGGNVTGSVGSVVGAVGSVTGNVGGNVTGSVGSVVGAVGSVTADVGITQAAADKVLGTSAAVLPELTTVPGATPTPGKLLMLIYQTLKNKLTTTATAKTIYNDAGSALGAKVLSDNGTVYTEDKLA